MFQNYFKKRKIKKYARKMPQALKSQYGYQKFYSKAQVDTVIKRKRLDNNATVAVTDNCYAYAMYCSSEEFQQIHDDADESCDYGAMRTEISTALFNNASDFTFSSLLIESSSAGSTSFGGFSDGGGDGGGGE